MKNNNKRLAALSYQILGDVASERDDFDAADSWYNHSLHSFKELGDELATARIYNQLGIVEYYKDNNSIARRLYLQAIEIYERFNDKIGADKAIKNLALLKED
ncbi:MAG: tetratricopeptide repeat protein [Defluviitaleaceae bacterium]|nr:tetratricopeptide repeat protein [Defluviitaleaceae bacterium]